MLLLPFQCIGFDQWINININRSFIQNGMGRILYQTRQRLENFDLYPNNCLATGGRLFGADVDSLCGLRDYGLSTRVPNTGIACDNCNFRGRSFGIDSPVYCPNSAPCHTYRPTTLRRFHRDRVSDSATDVPVALSPMHRNRQGMVHRCRGYHDG